MRNELKKELNEKYGRINEIRKVAEKISESYLNWYAQKTGEIIRGFDSYMSYVKLMSNRIEDSIRKFEKYIVININMYNVDNDVITWYNDDSGIVIMFDSPSGLQGINITKDKYMNDAECRLYLNID